MEYNGYDLFVDVEDVELQARNRAVVLWNIFESYCNGGKTAPPQAMVEMLGYLKQIPEDERRNVVTKFRSIQGQKEAMPECVH